MLLGELGAEGLVVEGGLDGALAVVEVAAHAEDADVVAALRDHLLALDVGDAVGGVEHDDAGVVAVREALERGLAGVARGGDQDQVVVGRGPRSRRSVERLREEQRQALQRHVLEGARRTVPQLEHPGAGHDLFDRRDALVVELRAVRVLHELVDALAGSVDAEAREHGGGAPPVRPRLEGEDLLEGEVRQLLGHVEPAARRDARDDHLGERASDGIEPARVVIVGVLHASMIPEAEGRRGRRLSPLGGLPLWQVQ